MDRRPFRIIGNIGAGAVSEGELREIQPRVPKSRHERFDRIGASIEQQFKDVFVFRQRCEIYGVNLVVPGLVRARRSAPASRRRPAILRSFAPNIASLTRIGAPQSAGISIHGENPDAWRAFSLPAFDLPLRRLRMDPS